MDISDEKRTMASKTQRNLGHITPMTFVVMVTSVILSHFIVYQLVFEEPYHLKNEEKLKLPLATIDMVEARKDPAAAAAKLGVAMETVGFVYLVNIPGFQPDQLYQATRWFFGLPLESRMQIAKRVFKEDSKNLYRGYFPLIPGGHSYKEVFEIGSFFTPDPDSASKSTPEGSRPLMRDLLSEANVWPQTGVQAEDERFRQCLEYHYQVYMDQANFLMSLLARHLELPLDFFHSLFHPKSLSTFRIIHYPSRVNFTDVPEEAKDGKTLITTGEHADTSVLTLLCTFKNPGLQIDVNHDGNWIDIPAVNDAMVVNIGALLSRMTGYRYKATFHRVIDVGYDRFSSPFFLEPRFDGDISKTIDGQQITGAGEYKKYGPWMTNRTSQFVEYKTTDFGIID